MDNTEETVADALAALRAAIDDFWATLDADTELDEEDRAEITQLVEGAGDNLDEAKRIVRANAERD